MRYLQNQEKEDAIKWMYEAGKVASKALCLRAKCGTVIVKDGEVIGSGYNAPPLDDNKNQKCLYEYDFSGKPKYDHTCCMHAEWRAILNTFKENGEKIKNSKLYFTRVDEAGNILKSGKPFCTVCSRFALDCGVSEFLLWHEEGICSYETREYNNLSYSFRI